MNAKAFFFWTGISLAAHLALFTLSPTSRPLSGTARQTVAVHLLAPAAAPSPLDALPPVAAPPVEPAPLAAPRPQSARPPAPDRSPAPAPRPKPPAVLPSPPPRPAEPGSFPAAALNATVPAAFPPAATAPLAEDVPAPVAASPPTETDLDFSIETAAPLYERNPPPSYPRLAQARGWEGEVRLRVRVAVTGDVLAVTIERSSGYAILDRAAHEAVRGWRFRPARQAGVPVESEAVVPINYQLEGL